MVVVMVIKNRDGGVGSGGGSVGGGSGGDFVNKIKISFCYFHYF